MMRRLFTVLIWVTRICFGSDPAAVEEKPVLKRDGVLASPRCPVPTGRCVAVPETKVQTVASPPPILLDALASEAVRVSAMVRSESIGPSRGSDGSVVYPYGRGLPVLVCAPLRVCFIEFEPGEKITGEPVIGDSLRWLVSPGLYGGVNEGTQVVIVKPQDPNIETNLLVMTDRRPYYIRLVSSESEYVSRVAFRYPEDNSNRWMATVPPAPEAQPKVLPAIIATERLNFGYRVSGGDEHIRPRRVYDDGAKTFLQMPPTMENREAPALLVVGSDGKGIMTNYRVVNGTYIVDALFDKAQLRIGTKKKKYVTIEREDRG